MKELIGEFTEDTEVATYIDKMRERNDLYQNEIQEISKNSHFGKGVSIKYKVSRIFQRVGVYTVQR